MNPDRWHAIWSRRGVVACALWPVAQVYGALGALHRWLYRSGLRTVQRLPVPVLVVGNVVVGGAGKTPTVIALVQHLRAQGWRPGVVSRGYGRSGRAVLEVLDDSPASISGDEPLLIRRATQVPVYVAARRVDAARALLAAHPAVNLLLCDDGLQHLALGRDLSVVVFDDRGVGNGWQLPAGCLREPWPPAAGSPFRPDLLLSQRRDDASGPLLHAAAVPLGMPAFVALRRLADVAVGPQGQRVKLADLRDRSVTAVAGIARPDVFFDMLRARGLRLDRAVALPDHAQAPEYAALNLRPGDTMVCTEKDAVKLFATPLPGVDVWAVPLEMTPEPAFWTALDALLSQRTVRR